MCYRLYTECHYSQKGEETECNTSAISISANYSVTGRHDQQLEYLYYIPMTIPSISKQTMPLCLITTDHNNLGNMNMFVLCVILERVRQRKGKKKGREERERERRIIYKDLWE